MGYPLGGPSYYVRGTIIKKLNATQKKLERMNITTQKDSRLKSSINRVYRDLETNCLTDNN